MNRRKDLRAIVLKENDRSPGGDEQSNQAGGKAGILTAEERKIMESHVIMTKKILDKVHFTEKYSRVNAIASNHHECLDGSGYPNGFRADKLDQRVTEWLKEALKEVDITTIEENYSVDWT